MFKIIIINTLGNTKTAAIVADDPLEFWEILTEYIWPNSIIKLNFRNTPPDNCSGEVVFESIGLIREPSPEYSLKH